MFKKSVSTVELANKINHLDNKLDIILTKMNEGIVKSCCDCKYKDIKCYIDEKFITLQDLVSNINTVSNLSCTSELNRLELRVTNALKDVNEALTHLETMGI